MKSLRPVMPTQHGRAMAAALGVLAFSMWAAPAFAQGEGFEPALPRGLHALVPAGLEVLAWRRADLNLDGHPDVVFILQAKGTTPFDGDRGDLPRPLLVALGHAGGALHVVARNDQLVRCINCGGSWPEPFDELTAEPGRFTLSHYGGSRWRWSERWRFDFDVQANTWYLSSLKAGADSAEDGHLVRTYLRGKHFKAFRFSLFRPDTFTAWQSGSTVPQPPAVRDDSRS